MQDMKGSIVKLNVNAVILRKSREVRNNRGDWGLWLRACVDCSSHYILKSNAYLSCILTQEMGQLVGNLKNTTTKS